MSAFDRGYWTALVLTGGTFAVIYALGWMNWGAFIGLFVGAAIGAWQDARRKKKTTGGQVA